MSLNIKKHFRRFEVKYLIPENYADKIIPSVLENMEWDTYAQKKEYYKCYSLYTDGINLNSYNAVVNGDLFRKKLRFRFYDKNANYGFLEIKRKKHGVIIKDREQLSINDFKIFLKDPLSLKLQNWDKDFTEEAIAWHWENKLESKLWVICKRKPFIHSLDSQFRVTFDYDLIFSEIGNDGYSSINKQKKYEKKVIMEAKFTEKMPLWFKNIIDIYKLESSGFSKYCTGIETLNLQQRNV